MYFDDDDKEDRNMIISDFSRFHHIRLHETNNEELSYPEYIDLLYGLLLIEDSSLGKIVRIRSTPSTEFAQLSKGEQEIWLEWRQKHPECVQHTRKLTLKDLYGDEDEE